MGQLETKIINSASGVYRWNDPEQGWKQTPPNGGFESGDAIKIDPFPDTTPGSEALWPIFGTFCEYVEERIVKVYIPPESNEHPPVWFKDEPGEYLIHEGYLTPQ